ncbi:MAG TPA: helix-turn-helix domain-containing protein [Streptosporangiaceae bacterium]|jgi:AcrR family transcriptional regulator
MAEHRAGRRPGRPPRSTAPPTRERLLDAALDLFAEKGFAATSVRQIAEAVGVRDSAIYGHFSGKQEIFDTLLGSVGLLELGAVGTDAATLAELGPARALPALAGRVIDAFDQPRARKFASVMMREGLYGRAAGSRSLAQSIADVQAQLHEPFRHWAKAGLLRDDFPPEQLVWELLAPLANIRFVYLHAQATPEERRDGREFAERHVRFFLACVLREPGEGAPRDPQRAASPD